MTSDQHNHDVTISLLPEEVELLAVLGRAAAAGAPPDADPVTAARAALEHLTRSAIDGVRRPMSWERGWLAPAFGEEWQDGIERDPADRLYDRPKGRR